MIIHIHSILLFTRMILNVLTVHFKHCNTHKVTERGLHHLSDCCLELHPLT